MLKEKDLKIERQEENLILNKKNLYDINIMYLSQIKFNKLKEIDLSNNGIINIELLCNMNLPFLEFLNLSYNRIRNIEPLSEIISKNLKYLFIQNNEIVDIQVFCYYIFIFDILRLENNNIGERNYLLKVKRF